MTSRLLKVSMATLLIVGSTVATAHDIVLVPEASGLRVRMGHPGDWQNVDKERLLNFNVNTDQGQPEQKYAELRRQGLDFVLPKPTTPSAAVLSSARYDNGLWIELPAIGSAKPEWRNTSRFMMPSASKVMISTKFAKGYSGPATDTTTYAKNVGHLLELVPQKNPLSINGKELLPVLLLLNGKPLAGAGIEVSNLKDKIPEDKIPRFVTDEKGIAMVPLRSKGINTLAVDVKQANDGSFGPEAKAIPAETIMMVATYTFIR